MSLLITNRKIIIILKTLTHFKAICYLTCSGIVFGMPFGFLIFTINPLYLCNWKHHVFSFWRVNKHWAPFSWLTEKLGAGLFRSHYVKIINDLFASLLISNALSASTSKLMNSLVPTHRESNIYTLLLCFSNPPLSRIFILQKKKKKWSHVYT